MEMLSPGECAPDAAGGCLGPMSIRLRTELAVEAWHWNPRGRVERSAASREVLDFRCSAEASRGRKPIMVSYSYKLPRRGQMPYAEANDDGYSRLDDGDPATFWKSNPYLAQPFTGNGCRAIRHGSCSTLPNQSRSTRSRFTGPTRMRRASMSSMPTRGASISADIPMECGPPSSTAGICTARAVRQVLSLSKSTVKAQYLRIWMTESSGTAAPGSRDLRDQLGYAVREISAEGGPIHRVIFHDEVIPSARSSTRRRPMFRRPIRGTAHPTVIPRWSNRESI